MRNLKELLSVIFILFTLVLVIGMSHSPRRQHAEDLKCRDHLRGLHQGAVLYQKDHDGMIPPVLLKTSPRWTFWYAPLRIYVARPEMFYCPANPRGNPMLEKDEGAEDLLPPVFDPLSVSYGMNHFLGYTGKPEGLTGSRRIREVADPSYVVYYGDSKGVQLRPTKGCWEKDYGPVHQGRINLILVDGHTESFEKFQLGLWDALDGWKRDRKRWRNWRQ